MDFSKSILPDHPVIHTWSRSSLGPALRAVGFTFTSPGSGAWSAANRALYYPFYVNQIFNAAQMFVYNGATISGNLDVGIYDLYGNRLVSSGSTAQSGASVLQVFNITDTLLAPGDYYFALAFNNTTATIQLNLMTSASLSKTMGILQQESAFPLPATATMATATDTKMVYMGVTKRTMI